MMRFLDQAIKEIVTPFNEKTKAEWTSKSSGWKYYAWNAYFKHPSGDVRETAE